MEILTENGDVKTDKTPVLNKWKKYIENLYNQGDNAETQNNVNPYFHLNSYESVIMELLSQTLSKP